MGDLKTDLGSCYISTNGTTINWEQPVSIIVDDSKVAKGNAAYKIWHELNNMTKEDKDMKVLDIYEQREVEYIKENFKITKEELIKNDPFVKLHDKYVKDIEKLYKKEYDRELECKSVLGTEFLAKETREAIEKADEQKVFELENLDELLVEVKAMLDMTNDYDKKIEILKKYQILNEEGMINA